MLGSFSEGVIGAPLWCEGIGVASVPSPEENVLRGLTPDGRGDSLLESGSVGEVGG
jgi:hypothetical protein